jgi:hypothetical protein
LTSGDVLQQFRTIFITSMGSCLLPIGNLANGLICSTALG